MLEMTSSIACSFLLTSLARRQTQKNRDKYNIFCKTLLELSLENFEEKHAYYTEASAYNCCSANMR